MKAWEMVKGNKQILTCFVHIMDPQLSDFLTEKEMTVETTSSFRLEIFNVFRCGAAKVLDAYSPFSGSTKEKPPHIIIAGFGRIGESLVIETIRRWRNIILKEEVNHPVKITVIDRCSNNKDEILRSRFSSFSEYCKLDIKKLDVNQGEFIAYIESIGSDNPEDVNYIYVCLGDDSFNISTGLNIVRHLRGKKVEVISIMESDSGLSSLLKEKKDESVEKKIKSNRYGCLKAFGVWSQICKADITNWGLTEKLARAFHEDYCEMRNQSISLFSSDDILDYKDFTEKLKSDKNPYKSIWKALESDCSKKIENWNNNEPADEAIKDAVVKALNKVLVRRDFYSYKTFKRTRLKKGAVMLKAKGIGNLKKDELMVFNRLLLESVFPKTIKNCLKGNNVSITPWENLSESYKESNRLRADSLYSLFEKVNLEIVPLTYWDQDFLIIDSEKGY